MAANTQTEIPYRQIRALFNEETITVYQAYSKNIAEAAVREHKLDASEEFKYNRMTWIKPSWCWMMYRSGYGSKDSRQSHILAIKMTHAWFKKLLSEAVVCHGQRLEGCEKMVRVQWDPERDPGLRVLPYRSIQIGIGKGLVEEWVKEGILSIEDVSDKAGALKRGVERGVWEIDHLRELGVLPQERIFDVGEELRKALGMDE